MADITPAEKIFSAPRSQSRTQASADATRVLDLAARAARRLDERLNEGFLAAGLSTAQGRALRAIAARPGLTVGELNARLGISKQSLAPVLRFLVRRGLVTASGTPADRRLRLLHLTPNGEAAWNEAAGGALDLLAAASEETGPGGAGGFRAMLQRLTELPDSPNADAPKRSRAP